MNCLFKYLVLSTLLVFLMSSASAVFQDLNAWDANSSRHANKGEDFNVGQPAAFVGDINSDFNYLIALNYNGTYVDLNIQVRGGTEAAASVNTSGVIDANVRSRVLSGGTGPCPTVARDVNVLVFMSGPGNDLNTFNVTVTVPSSGDIDQMVGHEVMVELWPLVNDGDGASKCGATKVADGNFIVGPAILVYTPNSSNEVAAIDQNITIFGFGFTPALAWDGASTDNNVTISIYDANNVELSAVLYQDMNISKAYLSKSVPMLGTFHRESINLDTNGQVRSLIELGWAYADWNGITVYPDTNGEFDVNLTIPYVSNTAGSTIGRRDLNTLRASSSVNGDVNAFGFYISPKITEYGDVNVTVTIGSRIYDINTALLSNLVLDLTEVSGIIMRLGSVVDADANRQVVVVATTDLNLAKTPAPNYVTGMSGKRGFVRIDTDALPEFAGATFGIAMYNVVSASTGSDVLPTIAKDNVVCPASTCSSVTWAPNSSANDGNLSFTVSGFSDYLATDLNVWVITPNGGDKIRTPRHNADENYTIHFKLKDLNVQDNNIDAIGDKVMQAIIYYSNASGAKTGQIINDTNLFDTMGIRCNDWNDFCYWGNDGNITGGVNGDVNLANWNDCYFDLNRSDLNSIFGEFVVDVNVMGPFGRDLGVHEETIIGSSDANVFFNPPLIEITDTNINGGNFVMNFGLPGCEVGHCQPDINFVVDFNIYLPGDINGDQNFTLEDYNVHFYLSSVQGGITADVASDLNNAGDTTMFDQNFGLSPGNYWDTNTAGNYSGLNLRCEYPAREGLDYACTMQYDTNYVFENKNYLVAKIIYTNPTSKSVWIPSADGDAVKQVMDVNELWDINSSAYQFTINDNNKPRTQGGTTTATVTRNYTMALTCDDNTSGVEHCIFRDGTNIVETNAGAGSYTHTFTEIGSKPVTKTFYGQAVDYAGNSSDINVTAVVTFSQLGSGPLTQPGGPSGTPTVTAGTEVILEITISKKPTSEEIRNILTEAGASENAIEKASTAVGKTSVSRIIRVEKITDEQGNVSYKTTMTLQVTNAGRKKLKNVKVVERIPKGVAKSASEISSLLPFTVLKEDPIIEFILSSINPNSTQEITYSVDSKVSEGTTDVWTYAPITADLEEVAPCEGVTCDPGLCQTGACNPGTGICEYQNKADGTGCGVDKECEAGTCVETVVPVIAVCGNGICEAGEDSTTCPSDCPPSVPDYTIPIVVGIIILLIIIGGAYYYKNYYKKGKGK